MAVQNIVSMKKLLTFVMAAGISIASFAQTEAIKIGTAVPASKTTLTNIDGKETNLEKETKKNGLLVMFSCNTCPYVVANEERTVEILKYAQTKNIGVVVVNSNEAQRSGVDSKDAMSNYAKKLDYKWAYTVDQNHVVADAFGATKTPEVFLFDGKGILAYHGAIDDSPKEATEVKTKHLKNAIDQMTSGKEVSVKTSKSIGCTIKRLATK